MADQQTVPTLISEGYRQEQRMLHQKEDYGVASTLYGKRVADLVKLTGATEVLDYGAGKGRLADAVAPHLEWEITLDRYDPAVEEFAEQSDPAELVVCIDVLEHIEPDHLDGVLDDLKRVTKAVGFFTIATGPALKVLSDGRNAHLIQQDIDWWLPRLWTRFRIKAFEDQGNHFWVIVHGKTGLQ